MESIVDDTVTTEDLRKFERIYNDQLSRGQPSHKAQFEYAWCLVRCNKQHELQMGIALLEDLLSRDESGTAKRDYLFYLAIGHLRLKQYERATQYVNAILRVEPTNGQARDMQVIIDKRMKRDGMIGAAILGGAVLAGGALLVGGIAALASRRSN